MKTTLRWIGRAAAVGALAVALAGCQSAAKPKSLAEKANERWNAARSVVQYNLARQQFESGDLSNARKAIAEAITLNPAHAPSQVLSARIAIEQGQLEAAQRMLAEAARLDPDEAEADYHMGVVNQRWQRLEEALASYGAAVTKSPSELAYVLAEAEMLVALDRRPQAIERLREKVVFFENSAAIRDALGQLYQAEGRQAEAIGMFRQAATLSAEDDGIRERLALALYVGQQWREAADRLSRLTSKPDHEKRGDLLVALGECQLQLDRVREAREAFERAAQADPSHAAAWLGLAKAASALGDARRADLSLRKVLALAPDSAEAHLLMGYTRLEQEKADEALAMFRRASDLDTADPVSETMVGYTLQKLGRSDEAMRHYAEALRRKPGDELASRLLASVDSLE